MWFLYVFISSFAAMASAPPKAKLDVTGHEVIYTTKDKTADVKGAAEARRTLGLLEQILTADTFKLHFGDTSQTTSSNSKGISNIKTLIAQGNVCFKGDNKTLTANTCTYNVSNETIKCEGNVTIIDGGNTLKGEQGHVDLNKKIYKVSRLTKPVEAQITPKSAIHARS